MKEKIANRPNLIPIKGKTVVIGRTRPNDLVCVTEIRAVNKFKLSRLAINVMLALAAMIKKDDPRELEEMRVNGIGREYQMPIEPFADLFGYYGNNITTRIGEAVNELNKARFAVNPKKKRFSYSGLIMKGSVGEGKMLLAIDRDMMDFYRAVDRAKYRLRDVAKFRTIGAYRLYELLLYYLGTRQEGSFTIPVEILQKVLISQKGDEETESEYKDLKRWYIIPAIAEINGAQAMEAVFREKKEGSKVTALEFNIRRTYDAAKMDEEDFIERLSEEAQKAYAFLRSLGLSRKEVEDALAERGEDCFKMLADKIRKYSPRAINPLAYARGCLNKKTLLPSPAKKELVIQNLDEGQEGGTEAQKEIEINELLYEEVMEYAKAHDDFLARTLRVNTYEMIIEKPAVRALFQKVAAKAQEEKTQKVKQKDKVLYELNMPT